MTHQQLSKVVRTPEHVRRVLAQIRSCDPEGLGFKAKVRRNTAILRLENELSEMLNIRDML